jgi:alpha-tubulin suppressor-like RCC1 family protein
MRTIRPLLSDSHSALFSSKKNIFYIALLITFNLFYISTSAQCWSKISAGGYHVLAINLDGKLWAWGANYNGELGDGTTVLRNTPTLINSSSWQEVSCKGSYSLGLKTDGTLWSWGYNGAGQLGDGTGIENHTPTQVGTASNWLHIASGGNHSTAIKSDGTLWTWGSDEYGQLGDGGTNTAMLIPTQIGIETNWQKVYASAYNTFAIRQDGTLWGFGRNHVGQLGDGTVINKNAPVQIGTAANWAALSVGTNFTVGLKTDGTLWAWGDNFYGQLGDGTNIGKNVPTQIGSLTNWQTISCGFEHIIAQNTAGNIYAWGNGQNGALGVGGGVNYNTPTFVNMPNVQSISSGFLYSLVISSTNKLWATGTNANMQFGNGSTTGSTIFTEVACPVLSTANFENTLSTIKVYPNPIKDILTIQNTSNLSLDKITITDLAGKKIMEQNGSTNQINVSQLQQGMYLLKITSKGENSVTKFIKQ